MTRLVVHCGLCGHEPGVQLDVADDATAEQMREAVAELIGPSLRCERCNSILLSESGIAADHEPPRVAQARQAEQMRRRIRGVRFAVGSPDGPHGTTWRIWVNRNDVYVAARSAATDMKVSLHASGSWRAAFTERHMASENPLISTDRDRAVDRWNRPAEFATGWTRAFTIVVPASEVVASEVAIARADEIIWIDPLPDGWATHFNVLLAAPDATGSEGRGYATAEGRENFTDVVTAIALENGERAWVVVHAEEVDDSMKDMIETVRSKAVTEGADAIARVHASGEPYDLRGFAGGVQADGTRFYLDFALPRPADG